MIQSQDRQPKNTQNLNKNSESLSFKVKKLVELAGQNVETIFKTYHTSLSGLSSSEANRRFKKYGPNELTNKKNVSVLDKLVRNLKDPLSALLIVLAIISFITKDLRAAYLITAMVFLSVVLRFIQELKADRAVEKLKAMIHTTATVIRHDKKKEIVTKYLVPGDIVHLSAGDMIPADLRLIVSKDLFVNQAALTGESVPAEKHAEADNKDEKNFLDCFNLCFFGTSVESGTATAIVIATGSDTYFSSIAESLTDQEEISSFDQGIKQFTWLIIKFVLVLAPLVFIINGLSKGNWVEAFLFAVAITVGLTPEMLPMIMTVNLSKGALDMSRKKVIVKRLSAIQNFGAMDILCTDKTGTITLGRVVLEKHLDLNGQESHRALTYAYLNSHFQTGLNNLLDNSILEHKELGPQLQIEDTYKKFDEIPFDFVRRRMSVVVEDKDGQRILICKGAVEEMFNICTQADVEDKIIPFSQEQAEKAKNITLQLNNDGFRVMAVAYKKLANDRPRYTISDESNLIILGLLAFWDPPKDTANQAIQALNSVGIKVKILTGDNKFVTRKVCREVGLEVDQILLGSDIDAMSDEELAKRTEEISVFAKLTPTHKEKIIKILRQNKHAVGFLGDGINDAAALKAADIGISVDTAVDIAKESSDIILLEKSLLVLKDGVLEGRRIFGNITKYIQMAASSNFGNMFSVVGGSIFLPFLPMLPLQILTNNMLYDFSQISIPTDRVDEEYLVKPRQWNIKHIKNFILYIGPMSSIFDYLTYIIMLVVFKCWDNPALFHTGWFVESLFSQTLIIYVIRTHKIPFLQSNPSLPLTITSLLVLGIGAYLPFSPLASYLGFVPLPPLYWLLLLIILILYFVITQAMKTWFNKKYNTE